jgi:hypothetical protein
VIWATGYRPDYSWLDVSCSTAKGTPFTTGGVTAAPGLYVCNWRHVGTPLDQTRSTSYCADRRADPSPIYTQRGSKNLNVLRYVRQRRSRRLVVLVADQPPHCGVPRAV